MKLTPSEAKLVDLIKAMPGGSYCPGRDATVTSEVNRLLRRLGRRGVLSVEATDDGPRFTVVDHG
ncbi:hypothetical protein ACFOOL_16355 [Devosia honganensis]|uniref:MarR family transcriptional regulator n=1 Tax=Devosia honganensis TaxID=1610527 RepID=A0ABV7X477_9HYPH